MDGFTPAEVKKTIAIEDVEKLDVRVGTVIDVADLPKSKNIVRLTVNFGDRERTVLAGIKGEREDPKEIIGKQALFVVNLEPRKMMGVLSEGMLFDIGYADGLTPCLAQPERPMPDGSRAG